MNTMKPYLIILLAVSFFSCAKQQAVESIDRNTKFQNDSLADRLIIIGNFDGNHQSDTLKESFFSAIESNEISKTIDLEYDSAVSVITRKKAISSLISKHMAPITLDKNHSFGLLYLRNEGDLNNDGTDEIGLVIDLTDWSAVNTYRIYSYQKNKWEMLYQFEIREFDIYNLKPNEFLLKKSGDSILFKTYEMGEPKQKKLSIRELQ